MKKSITSKRRMFPVIMLIIGMNFSSVVLCQSPKSFSFKVDRNKTILPVKVGNSKTLQIILDSGMAFDGLLIYNPDIEESLNLINAREVEIGGAGSGKPSTALMADSANFSINNLKFSNQKILVLQNDIYRGFPSDGVMGFSILGHYVTEINYDDNQITLRDIGTFTPDESWTMLPIYFKNNMIPWIDISVVINDEEPIPMSVYIDYASGHAIELLEKPNQKFAMPDETDESNLGRGLSGDIMGKTGMISKILIGPYELKNVKASFAPAKVRSKQKNADAILGNNTFRRFNLIFDYASKKLYIKPNKHFKEPFN